MTSATDWPFGSLTPLKYGAIIADPPWSIAMYGAGGYGKSPEAHYATMSDDDIAALPVDRLAAREPWPGHDVWGNEPAKFGGD